jgi:hypothetical protein
MFCQLLIKFGMDVLYKKFSEHGFCENWPSCRDALCKGLNELCCPYFSLVFAEIQYIHISPCTTIDRL